MRELALQAGLQRIDTDTSPPQWRCASSAIRCAPTRCATSWQQALAAELGEAAAAGARVAGVPGDSPARREAAERERRQREAEAAIRDDPLVRDLLAQFKSARIVPGSIKPV